MQSYTVYHLALVALISLIATKVVRTTAFVVVSKAPSAVSRTTAGSKTMRFMGVQSTGETEIEKLLRMARELRAQAEESEKEVKVKNADKKANKEDRLGGLLNHLFYDGTKGDDIGTPGKNINQPPIVVERLKSKKPSVDTLEKFVDWMDDRRDQALGNEHVESKGGGAFGNVRSKKDDAEAERLYHLTERLLEALEVIDSENNPDDGHLGGGRNSADLRQRLKQKRRVRDSQFLKRQNAFVEARTIKEGSKYEYNDATKDDE